MTTNAEEETNPPVIAEIYGWMARLVERWSTNPKVGSNPTQVEVVGPRLPRRKIFSVLGG